MSEIWLPAREPFSFNDAISYLNRTPTELVDLVEAGTYRRVLRGADGLALIEIQASSRDGQPGVCARQLAGVLTDDELASWTRRTLRLDSERPLPHEAGPLAKTLYAHFAAMPVVQTATPFEAMVWAIIAQQITITFAFKVKRAFVETFGETLTHDGRVYYAFPSPERIVELDHERDLRPLQFSRQKSRYIIALSNAALDGRLDFAAIACMDDEQASAKLQEHLGIGRWTAEYALLRGLGRMDVIPAGDAGLKAAIGVHQQLGRNATEDEVRQAAASWEPYRGRFGFLIWYSLQHGWFHKAKASAKQRAGS